MDIVEAVLVHVVHVGVKWDNDGDSGVILRHTNLKMYYYERKEFYHWSSCGLLRFHCTIVRYDDANIEVCG